MDHAPMAGSLSGIIVSAIDLLALACCLGILAFRAFVISARNAADYPAPAALTPLWSLLGICLAVLTVSSVGWLLHRTMTSTGQPIDELSAALPIVLFKTHFGRVWLMRPIALLALWLGWRQARGRFRPRIVWMMLIAGGMIAASRSLSGHAAGWGDFTLLEFIDWLHLLAASAWGGSLIALTLTGFHAVTACANERRQAVVALVTRWSSFAGIALAVAALTGVYSAWRELDRFDALWTTSYGQALAVKLLLISVIVLLGAANRYAGIPALRVWAGGFAGGIKTPGILARALDPMFFGRMTRVRLPPLAQFIFRAALEGALMIAVIVVVTVLIGLVPARHAGEAPAGHMMHGSGMQ